MHLLVSMVAGLLAAEVAGPSVGQAEHQEEDLAHHWQRMAGGPLAGLEEGLEALQQAEEASR